MSENNLKMSSSPHIRSKATTSNIMMLVAIALLPASAFGVWNFGLPAFGMLVTTTVVAVLTASGHILNLLLIDSEYTLLLQLYFFLLYLHNILYTRNVYFHICISNLHVFQISLVPDQI